MIKNNYTFFRYYNCASIIFSDDICIFENVTGKIYLNNEYKLIKCLKKYCFKENCEIQIYFVYYSLLTSIMTVKADPWMLLNLKYHCKEMLKIVDAKDPMSLTYMNIDFE